MTPPAPRATPAGELGAAWIDTEASDPVVEVARRFALGLREAVAEQGLRAVAAKAGMSHSVVSAVIAGSRWPDLRTVARLEISLDRDLWPGRPTAP